MLWTTRAAVLREPNLIRCEEAARGNRHSSGRPARSTSDKKADKAGAVGRPPVEAQDSPPGREMKLLFLIVPCLLLLVPPLYNRVEPTLIGMPFFYWFQLILIPVAALGIYAADRLGKR